MNENSSPIGAPSADRSAAASANVAFGDNACFARRPLQFAGERRKTLATVCLTAETAENAEKTLLSGLCGLGGLCGSFFQNPHRSSTAPTVNPAPTDASSTRFPFFSRPLA